SSENWSQRKWLRQRFVKPVLLLVDLQRDFLRPGELEAHPAGMIAAAAELLQACRRVDVPVIHVWSTASKSFDNRLPHQKKRGEWRCLEGSAGHECPEELRPRKTEPVIHKTSFSGFSTEQLQGILRKLGADLLLLAGVHL